MLLLSKLFTCNLEKHDLKERIYTANKEKVGGQSDVFQAHKVAKNSSQIIGLTLLL